MYFPVKPGTAVINFSDSCYFGVGGFDVPVAPRMRTS